MTLAVRMAPAKTLLRPLRLADVARAHELLSDWLVVRYTLFQLCALEDSEKFVRDSMNDECVDEWRSIVRVIIDGQSGDFAGMCGIVVSNGSQEGEVWYVVNPNLWGRGLATDAVRELLQFGFGELRLRRMWASCLPENPASMKVLERAGFRREGLRRKDLNIHGRWHDSVLYTIMPAERRAPKSERREAYSVAAV
jgi:[ribosomal protein S5]-alanine N-acetyltransferase